jgi:hypothetical protein
MDDGADEGSRFDSASRQGQVSDRVCRLFSIKCLMHIDQLHRTRYWNQMTFDGLNKIKEVGEKHGLLLPEIGLW